MTAPAVSNSPDPGATAPAPPASTTPRIRTRGRYRPPKSPGSGPSSPWRPPPGSPRRASARCATPRAPFGALRASSPAANPPASSSPGTSPESRSPSGSFPPRAAPWPPGWRQGLQLLQVAHPRVQIPIHQLAQDLQPHLQTDEALQGPIVEIAGDPHPLHFAGLLRRLLRLQQLLAQLSDFQVSLALVHGERAGHHARDYHRPLQRRRAVRQDRAKHRAHRHNHHYFHRAVESQRFPQQEQEEREM